MEYHELTAGQLKLMLEVSCDIHMSVFSQCASQPGDPLEARIKMAEAAKDVEHLIGLSLLKDITAEHLEEVLQTNLESGRDWKVFEITPLGRAFFQAYQSVTVQ
jgi:hypothetical protein